MSFFPVEYCQACGEEVGSLMCRARRCPPNRRPWHYTDDAREVERRSREQAIRFVVAAQWMVAIALDVAIGLRDPVHSGGPLPAGWNVSRAVRDLMMGSPTAEQIVDQSMPFDPR